VFLLLKVLRYCIARCSGWRSILLTGHVQSRYFPRVPVHVLAIRTADEVPAVHIIDEAVAIIIAVVARNFLRIAPEIRPQVHVCGIDATVDHGDDDSALWLPACQQLTLRAQQTDAWDTIRGFVEELPVRHRFVSRGCGGNFRL